MKNINISLKGFPKLRLDNRYVFLFLLLVILVFDGLVIKDAIAMVVQLENQSMPIVSSNNGNRINFQDYDYVVQRIQNGQNFTPSGGPAKDPFNP